MLDHSTTREQPQAQRQKKLLDVRAHGNQGQAPDEETERTEEEGEQRDLHKLKGDGCETACTGTRDTQCVYVPYVLNVSLE